MNRINTTASALRLWALVVAAGAVVGLAGQVVAQSAPVRVEHTERAATEAREQAQQIVREMRKELSREDEGQKQVRVRVRTGGDEHVAVQPRTRVQVEPGEARRRVEVERRSAGAGGRAGQPQKRIAVRRIDGGGNQPEVCPECGHGGGDDGDDRVTVLRRSRGMEGLKGLQGLRIEGLEGLKGMKVEGLEGLQGMKIEGLEGLKELHGMELEGGDGGVFWLGEGGDRHELHGRLMELHGLGEGGDNHKLHEHLMHLHGQGGEGNVRGRAIVVGPDGQRQEFNFGGGESGKAKVKKQRIERNQRGGTLFRAVPGEGLSPVAPGHGGQEGHGTTGHGAGRVIIITPDGQRREFNFDEDGPRSEGPFEMHDGIGHTAHPFGGGASVSPARGDEGQAVRARAARRNAV